MNDGAVSYQIECQTTKKGKMIAGTKRRICWKFGFSNHDAMQKGLSGIDCRGEEHEVVFVWSLASGKKFVLADGHEVHWSKQSLLSEKFDGSWECSWKSLMAGANRELKVVAHASSSLFERKKSKTSCVADSSFRKFDLLIDGVSFSDMKQMFELGLTKTVKDRHSIQIEGISALWGKQDGQQQSQPKPQRRKHIYDNEDDSVSHYSRQSHQSCQPDLLYIEPNRVARKMSLSDSMPELRYDQQLYQHQQAPQMLLSDSTRSDQQPYQDHQYHQQAPLVARKMRHSESMPDLRSAFSTSPTSVMVAEGSVPHFKCVQHQQKLQQRNLSPISVRSMNPFDLYSTGAFKPQQQIQAQYNNNYYAHHQDQNRQSFAY